MPPRRPHPLNGLCAVLIVSLLFPAPGQAQDRVPVLPDEPFHYDVDLPDHFLFNAVPGGPLANTVIGNDNTPANNPITDVGATLGRVLFYDTALSANGTTACASCHVQADGFSDTALRSFGFEGGTTRRHSMGLSNARFYLPGRFFWDERAATLEDQVLQPFQDSVEMGLTIVELESIIAAKSYYGPLFTTVFGDATVNADRVSRALAQFVRSLMSFTSRFDQGRAAVDNMAQPFPNFTPQENQGKFLFVAPLGAGGFGCVRCHATEAFINPPIGPLNNGLDAVSTDDLGTFETTGLPRHVGAFKVPSLRNIAVTPPYMHDGRFATLQAVMQFYSNGIQNHPNLAPALRTPNGNPVRFNMTPDEIAALVAFCNTLTDPAFLSDPKFSDPFITVMSDCACGDIHQDGTVDLVDLAVFVGCFGLGGPAGACNEAEFFCSDLDGSGTIDLNDFMAFVSALDSLPAGAPPNCR